MHPGMHTIIQQWLTDVIQYIVYSIGGFNLLSLQRIPQYFIALFLSIKAAGCLTKNNYIKMLATVPCVLSFAFITGPRPSSISCMIFLVAIIILLKADQGNNKILWFLPVLSLLEVNFHASLWPFLFALVLAFCFPPLYMFSKNNYKNVLLPYLKEKMPYLGVIAFMFLAGFINPNGADSVLYLVKSYGVANSLSIRELAKPSLLSSFGLILVFSVLLTAVYLLCHIRHNSIHRMQWHNWYLAAGTTLLGSMHNRNIWICAIGILPLFVSALKEFTDFETLELTNKTYKKYKIVVLGFFAAVSLFVCLTTNYTIKDSGDTPVLAVEYLKQQDEEVILYNHFNNGPYFLFNGYRVYIDARPELYAPSISGSVDIISEYIELFSSAEFDYDAFVEKYGFNYLCVSNDEFMAVYVKCHPEQYERVVEGNGYVLYRTIE